MFNFKKIASAVLAGACLMTSSAFASEYSTLTKGVYEDGFVKLVSIADNTQAGVVEFASDTHLATEQRTIVIIPAEKAEATLTQDDLQYINQAAKNDTLWTSELGVKPDLATTAEVETTLPDGDYIVRIGSENAEDGIIEILLTVGEVEDPEQPGKKTLEFAWGDIDLDTKISINDAIYVILEKTATDTKTGDQYVIGETYGDFVWGDVDLDTKISINDAIYVILEKTATDTATGDEYVIGEKYTIEVE